MRPGRPHVEQPVVFLKPEGERARGAREFHAAEPAERHATTPRRTAREIIAEAQAEFPAFTEDLDELCR